MRVLNGESLINDASGLVAFKFAAAAAVTGAFSMGDAAPRRSQDATCSAPDRRISTAHPRGEGAGR
jgi:hypothetical protein